MGAGDGEEPVRLDSWLWAARFFKTRTLAAQAIDGGRVDLNGDRAKRSKPVRIGDQIRVRLGPYHHHLVVRGLAHRRGPAKDAVLLYEEDEASKTARLELAERIKAQSPLFHDTGKPSKKQRREIDRWKWGRGKGDGGRR